MVCSLDTGQSRQKGINTKAVSPQHQFFVSHLDIDRALPLGLHSE
jgi:hypothetical protein